MLVWTDEKPTVEGWFWLRNRGFSARIGEVCAARGKLWVAVSGPASGEWVDGYELEGAEWAGPVEPPEEPQP